MNVLCVMCRHSRAVFPCRFCQLSVCCTHMACLKNHKTCCCPRCLMLIALNARSFFLLKQQEQSA